MTKCYCHDDVSQPPENADKLYPDVLEAKAQCQSEIQASRADDWLFLDNIKTFNLLIGAWDQALCSGQRVNSFWKCRYGEFHYGAMLDFLVRQHTRAICQCLFQGPGGSTSDGLLDKSRHSNDQI